jgi:nitrogen fixation protein FixH
MSPAGDAVAVEITIRVYASGALSVQGPMADKTWMLAALEQAKQAVKDHRDVKQIVIPGRDVAL